MNCGLGHLHRTRCGAGDLGGQCHRRLHLITIGDDTVQDAHLIATLGADPVITGQQQFLGLLRANHMGRKHGNNAGSKANFWLAKQGGFTCNGQITRHQQFHRSADAMAVRRRNGRLRRVPELHDEVKILGQNVPPFIFTTDSAGSALLHVKSG